MGQRGGTDNYWIVNRCSAGRVCISPKKFIIHNGGHSFLFVATNSLSKLYTYVTAILKSIIHCDCSIRE